jgi:hypothetical protein
VKIMNVERIAGRVVLALAVRVAELEMALTEIAAGEVWDAPAFAERILSENRQRIARQSRENRCKWPSET